VLSESPVCETFVGWELNGEAAVTGWVDDELAVRIDLVPVGEQPQAVPQDHVEPIAHVGGGSRGFDRDVAGHGDAFPFFAVEPRDCGPGSASALHCYTCFAPFIVARRRYRTNGLEPR
jgi:hypothetical protein